MALVKACILALCVAGAAGEVCEGRADQESCSGCTSGGECQWTEVDGKASCVTGPDCANGGPAITSVDEAPCVHEGIYPLYCSMEAAEAASPEGTVHQDFAGLYMPEGVSPAWHGDYAGDADACPCAPAGGGGGGHHDGHDHGDHGGGHGEDGGHDEIAGSCYDPTTHVVSCDVAESACVGDGGYPYAPGYVGRDGCCHCRAGCDASLETGTDCEASVPGQGDGGHGADPGHGDHGGGHGGHGADGHGVGYDEPCQLQQTYPLFCSAAAAVAYSPVDAHHMMAGLFMPNGADPMHHGDYVGDAPMCTCEPAEDGGGHGDHGGHDHGGHGGHGEDGHDDEPTLLEIAKNDPDLSTLATAVQAAGLEGGLESTTLTLFAPTNAAFDALEPGLLDSLLLPANKEALASILKHHLGAPVMPSLLGEGMVISTLQDCPVVVGPLERGTEYITVGGPGVPMASVVEADIMASNGLVHKIDGVLVPLPTVWDIINDDDDLEQFEREVKKYHLDDNLQKYAPWTVFAPTNKAVNNVDWAVDVLGKQVIEYHMVEGTVYTSTDLADLDGEKIKTRQGDKIKVEVDATGGVSLEDRAGQEASFEKVDVQACNGVVHTIDTMLFYKNDKNSDAASRGAGLAVAAAAAALALLV